MFYRLQKGATIVSLLRIYNDIMKKSHEQRLITKEHIATHTQLFYSST